MKPTNSSACFCLHFHCQRYNTYHTMLRVLSIVGVTQVVYQRIVPFYSPSIQFDSRQQVMCSAANIHRVFGRHLKHGLQRDVIMHKRQQI